MHFLEIPQIYSLPRKQLGTTPLFSFRITPSTNNGKYYAYHSVRRESILEKFQRDDTLYSNLLFPVSCSTCFGRNPRPS
jgi:hypothetical protein